MVQCDPEPLRDLCLLTGKRLKSLKSRLSTIFKRQCQNARGPGVVPNPGNFRFADYTEITAQRPCTCIRLLPGLQVSERSRRALRHNPREELVYYPLVFITFHSKTRKRQMGCSDVSSAEPHKLPVRRESMCLYQLHPHCSLGCQHILFRWQLSAQ